MNIYLARYERLISHFQTLVLEGYTETHHIIPRCMGGTDEPSNLVKLTAKAHFVAHHLLHKAYSENRQLAYAFGMMLCSNDLQERCLTARMYEEARTAISKASQGRKRPDLVLRNKSRTGTKMPEERKMRISETLKRRGVNKGIKRPYLSERNKRTLGNPNAFKEYNERKKKEGFTPEEIEAKRRAGRTPKRKKAAPESAASLG